MVYDVNNNSKSDHTGELSPFVSESKLTLSCNGYENYLDMTKFICYYRQAK